MAAISTVHRKIIKIGTLIVVVLNSHLTNFRVSKTNSIAPPPDQKPFYILAILESIKMKLCILHQHHDLRVDTKFGNSATYWS